MPEVEDVFIDHPDSPEAIRLQGLAVQSPYAERAVHWYLEALGQNERGEDINEYLTMLRFRVRSGWGSHESSLSPPQVRFIADGRSDTKSHFDDRFQFAYVGQEDLFTPRSGNLESDYAALNAQRRREAAHDHGSEMANILAGTYNSLVSGQELRRTQHLSGGSLDRRFGPGGQRIGQRDQLHKAMAELTLRFNEPELATLFTEQIEDPALLIDLFFKSVNTVNSAATAVLQQLGDMRQALQEHPGLLADFLTREIVEFGDEALDIDAVVEEIMTLTSDPALFDQNELTLSAQIADLGDDALANYQDIYKFTPHAHEVRYELAKALLSQGRLDQAKNVMATVPANARSGDKEITFSTSFQMDINLFRAERDELTRREKLSLRRRSRYGGVEGHNAKLALALANLNDNTWLRRKARQAKAMARLTSAVPGYFEDRRMPRTEDVRALEERFPQLCARMGGTALEQLKHATAAGDHELSDKLFGEIEQSDAVGRAQKLLAAVAIAAEFETNANTQEELRAEIDTELELLRHELSPLGNPHADVVDQSEYRQEANAKLEPVFRRIGRIDDPVERLKLLTKMAETQVVQDTSVGSVWRELTDQTQETIRALQVSGKDDEVVSEITQLKTLGVTA